MTFDETITWHKGPAKNDLLVRAEDGEDIAHIFPRDGHPGSYTLMTRDHGGWWTQKPAQHFSSLVEARGHARLHAGIYHQQEKQHLQEASRHHVINNLQEQWKQMGGDPKTIRDFKVEWDRVCAAEHHTKWPDRDEGHER